MVVLIESRVEEAVSEMSREVAEARDASSSASDLA